MILHIISTPGLEGELRDDPDLVAPLADEILRLEPPAGGLYRTAVTDYELGVWRMFPMAVHNLFDIGAGALLAASPWIFGFADETANVWAPFVVIGLAAVFLGLTTKQVGGYSYRRRPTAATG